MIEKLEEIKKLGAYAVDIFFGEDIGCDDMDVPTDERRTRLIYTPAGYLGGRRVLWLGKYKDFIAFDFAQVPKQISNPPQKEEYEGGGYFAWGAELDVKK